VVCEVGGSGRVIFISGTGCDAPMQAHLIMSLSYSSRVNDEYFIIA